ncbi:MAG TPA: polyprenyl synthetase family protein, partial [Deltaproteobacteria bacterium]|nr:polyprenyl synthetase family protein [Deltaproteobacteria bacterium]
ILDVTSDSRTLGKSAGKDIAQSKATVVKVLGLDGARSWAQNATDRAVQALDGIGGQGTHTLREIARWMLERAM